MAEIDPLSTIAPQVPTGTQRRAVEIKQHAKKDAKRPPKRKPDKLDDDELHIDEYA